MNAAARWAGERRSRQTQVTSIAALSRRRSGLPERLLDDAVPLAAAQVLARFE